MKWCVHAVAVPVDRRGAVAIYQLQCREESFDLTTDGLVCPQRCLLYRPKWRAVLSRWRRSIHPIYWLERQPGLVKVVVIGGVIALPVLLAAIYFHSLADLAALCARFPRPGEGSSPHGAY
jgi:hypothetical protein